MKRNVFAELDELRARIEQIEASRPRPTGPRDDCDIVLIATIAQTAVHRSFSCREVIDLSAVDAGLQQALDHADVHSAKQLGKLLRRVEGVPVVGLVIVRAGPRRWRVFEVTSAASRC